DAGELVDREAAHVGIVPMHHDRHAVERHRKLAEGNPGIGTGGSLFLAKLSPARREIDLARTEALESGAATGPFDLNGNVRSDGQERLAGRLEHWAQRR